MRTEIGTETPGTRASFTGLILAVTLMLGLALPAAAHAQVDRKCRPVAAGAWKASAISVYNMNCRSARKALRRWFRADRRPLLPRNPDGWQCGRYSLPGSQANRQCRSYPYGNDTAVGFVVRLERRPRASATAPCSYEERIIDVSDSTVNLGVDVGAAIDNAEDKADAQLARQFASFGQRLRRIEGRTAALDPPDALAAQHAAFRSAVRPVRRALFGIGRAARRHNARAARTATERLIEGSAALRNSRRALARRARARVTDGRC